MKTLSLALVAILVSFGLIQGVHAQSISMQSRVLNQYIGPAGGNFWAETVLQSDAVVSRGNFSLIAWHSSGLTSKASGLWSDFDDEVDFFATWGDGRASLGAGYFFLVREAANLDGDVITAFGSFSHSVSFRQATISPFVRLEFYSPSRGKTPKSGKIASVGVEVSGLLKDLSLSGKANLLHDTGAFGFEKSQHFQIRSSLSLPILSSVSLNGDFFMSTPISHVDDGRKTFVQWGVGLAKSF